jgi:hypothetical protein
VAASGIRHTHSAFASTRRLTFARFDSSRHLVLTDFLSSYELRPGVVSAGYGSLIERRALVEGDWIPGGGDYLTSQPGLFFKASYMHRF